MAQQEQKSSSPKKSSQKEMQQNHASLILDELAKHYTNGKIAPLAEKFGLQRNTLAGWKVRDTLDYERVYSHCKEVDPHWLLTGEGAMLKGTAGRESGYVAEQEITYSTPPAESNAAVNALQKVVALLERDNARMTAELEEYKAAAKTSLLGMGPELKTGKKQLSAV